MKSSLKSIAANLYAIARTRVGSIPEVTSSERAPLVTIGIKTFDRHRALARLLRSICIFSKNWNVPFDVVVVDDGNLAANKIVECAPLPIRYMRTDFDIGPARGRNIIAREARTPYVAIFDDDFVVSPITDIARMLAYSSLHDFDVLGGVVWDKGWKNKRRPRVLYEDEGKLFLVDALLRNLGDSCCLCDFVPNFFVAKAESLLRNPWRDELHLGEHFAFFIDAKRRGLRVGFCNAVGVVHLQDRDDQYRSYRRRAAKFHEKFLQIYGYTEVVEVRCAKRVASCLEMENGLCVF